jgi:hypothetical protein
MREHTVTRRRLAVAVAMAAGAIGLVAAFPAEATDNPEGIEGNPACGDLAPAGVEWTELKVDPVTGGVHTDGTLQVTITLHDTADGPTFDWTSNIGVDAVFVKGGPGGNLYTYNESLGDTGLHAPVNPNNDKFYGLSHISFCYDDDTTTTTKPTDTTKPIDTTVPTTDTTVPTTDTTVKPGMRPVAPVATPVPGQPTFTG